MRQNKGLILLLSIVLGLGFYAYFAEYKREINETELKKKQTQIVTLPKEHIQMIEISTAGQILKFTRTPDGWDLSGPINDQADNEIVESFLDQLIMEKSVDQISITPSIEIQQYGLNPSLGVISFEDNLGNKQTVEVSVKKNFEGLYFLRKDKQNQILTSGDSWFSFLSKPAEGFRNLKLFRSMISKVNEIKVANKANKIHLKYNQGIWQAVGHENMQLDQNAVRDILTQVSVSKGIESLKERPTGPILMSLELFGDDLKFKSDFYQDEKSKDLRVTVNTPSMSIRFGPQVLEKLRDIRVADLRDKTLPFQFETSQVSIIEFKTKLKKHKLVKTNGTWATKNSSMVEELLKKLRSLKVYRYLNSAPQSQTMTYDVALLDQEEKLLFQFSWSDINNHEAYARTSISNEVFQMDDAQIIRLELQNFFEIETKDKESSTK